MTEERKNDDEKRRRIVFLNACSQTDLDVLWASMSPRILPWNRYEDQRHRIEALYGIRMLHDRTGDIKNETHSGRWWMDWAECCIFYPGAVPSPLRPLSNLNKAQIQFRACPEGVNRRIFRTFQGDSEVVKLISYHVAYKHGNIGTDLPLTLGRGSSVSHYCDTCGCNRRSHLTVAAAHRDNMDRQRCPGVILTTLNGMIINQTKCGHDLSADFSESCRKFMVVSLDHLKPLVDMGEPDVIVMPRPGPRIPVVL